MKKYMCLKKLQVPVGRLENVRKEENTGYDPEKDSF